MTLERKFPVPGEKWDCEKHGHQWIDASRPTDNVHWAVRLCAECGEVVDTSERRKESNGSK